MHTTITGRRFEVTEPIRAYAEERLGRIEKFNHMIVETHLMLEMDKYQQVAELVVMAKHLRLSCKAKTDDMYTSINEVVRKIERQLKTRKEKKGEYGLKRQPKMLVTEAEKIEAEETAKEPVIMRVRPKTLKPMSAKEAALELAIDKDSEFLVFRNQDTEVLNIIYKMKNGSFGLIESE